MTTRRTRSVLLTWGAVIMSGTLLVAACSGDPVATGTVAPVTTQASAATSSAQANPPSDQPGSSNEVEPSILQSAMSTPAGSAPSDPSSGNDGTTPGPVFATKATSAVTSPVQARPPSLDAPPGATQKTAGGASDVSVWWLELGTAALEGKSTAVLQEFSSPACAQCNELIEALSDQIDSGTTSTQKGDSWQQVIQADLTSSETATVIVYAYFSDEQLRNRTGEVIQDIPAFNFVNALDLEWTDGHWVVAGVRPVEGGNP